MAHPLTPLPRSTTQLQDLLSLSHVPRWTTHPVARPQSVAEHSYRVAVIARALLDYADVPVATGSDFNLVMEWALNHDGPESKTGDIPSPVKRLIPNGLLEQLEQSACSWYQRPDPCSLEDDVVGLADTIEAISWISKYGEGMKDKFDGSSIEQGLRDRLWAEAKIVDGRWKGMRGAVVRIMEEICQ